MTDVSKFKIDVYIPSWRTRHSFNELTNKIYKNILKYIQTRDDEKLEGCLMDIVQFLGNIPSSKLNKIDLFCILLTLRIVCVGPTIELQFNCNKTRKKYNTTVDLNDVLQTFTDIGEDVLTDITLSEDITIKVGIPERLYADEDKLIDIMTYCVDCIDIKGVSHQLTTLSQQERHNIINALPGKVFNYLVRYANSIQAKFNKEIILAEKSPHDEDSELHEHKLALYNNSMFNFIRLIFTDNLVGYYEMIYSLSSNTHLPPDYVESLTPAETAIFLSTRRKEVAEQERQQRAQDTSNQGPDLPNRMSGLVDNI